MTQMGKLGYSFLNAINRAHEAGAPNALIQEARQLLSQISGSPDDGATECMRNAGLDLQATQGFVDKWKAAENNPRCSELLRIACQMLSLLMKFNEILKEMSLSERVEAEKRALLGRVKRDEDLYEEDPEEYYRRKERQAVDFSKFVIAHTNNFWLILFWVAIVIIVLIVLLIYR